MTDPNGRIEPPLCYPVTVRTVFARLSFDGHTLRITRRLCPLPWGRTTHMPLRDVMAVEGHLLPVTPNDFDGRSRKYYWIRHRHHGAPRIRSIRLRRRKGAAAKAFDRFQDVVNEAVVDRAREIIDARGPGAPTGPAHWDARFQAKIAHGLRTPYPLADEARFKNHTLFPAWALTRSGAYVLHQLRLRDGALLEWHRFVHDHDPPALARRDDRQHGSCGQSPDLGDQAASESRTVRRDPGQAGPYRA